MRWLVSGVFLPELSSVGEFLDFVSNAKRGPLEELQRGHAVAMPLREGIRNHAVGHPATFGTQSLHAPSEHAQPFSRTAAMTTSGFSNQMVKSTLGVNNAHDGWVQMDGTVGLHDCDYRCGGESSSVQGGAVISLDCRFPTVPGSTRLFSSPSLSMKTSPVSDADTFRLTRMF